MPFENQILIVPVALHYLGLIKLQLGHNCKFALVIENFPVPVGFVMTQVDNHVRIRLISQLIKGISRMLQNLLKYFNGATILTSFVLSAAGFFSVIFNLRYYATFRVRRFYSLLYKINSFFQKASTCIGLRAEQIFSVSI